MGEYGDKGLTLSLRFSFRDSHKHSSEGADVYLCGSGVFNVRGMRKLSQKRVSG
jgi:hypothetical protein